MPSIGMSIFELSADLISIQFLCLPNGGILNSRINKVMAMAIMASLKKHILST